MVMTAARQEFGKLISRAHVDAVADPSLRTTGHIFDAAQACDFVRAAVIAFARARAGEAVSTIEVCSILPGLRDITIAANLMAIASGDRGAAWMTCVRERMFPALPDAAAVELVVLYAAWRAGAPAAEVAPEARRLARSKVAWRGYALLHVMGKDAGDRNLRDATRHFRVMAESATGREFVASVDRVLSGSIANILDALPAEVAPQPVASGFTVRIGPRVGRNEPCSCGSGQKYKRCCADSKAQVTPSPVAGLSWDEYVTKAADRMSADDVNGLPLRELARVDLRGLAEIPLVGAVMRFTTERLFDHASCGARELGQRNAPGVDGVRDAIIAEALEAGDLDTASQQLDCMRDPTAAGLHQLEIDLRLRRAGALEAIAKAADKAVRNDNTSDAADLACTLMRAVPSLGILVARGAIRGSRQHLNDTLLAGIEETRDALNLPAGDAAWDVHAALKADDDAERDSESEDNGEHEKVVAEATALRGSLRAASSRLDDLERQLAGKQAELDAARTTVIHAQPVTTASDQIERERMRNLRTKVDALEGLIREGNAERGDLRRQLAAAGSTARVQATPPAIVQVIDNADDVACESIADIAREVAVPTLGRRVHDALDDVPNAVAAEALRTIGALGAGDANAWRRVKQAKDMPRQVLMARIGIHHRLLFRVEARSLEALDLVTRENLLATLKHMRSARG